VTTVGTMYRTRNTSMCDNCWHNVQNKEYLYVWQLLAQCTELCLYGRYDLSLWEVWPLRLWSSPDIWCRLVNHFHSVLLTCSTVTIQYKTKCHLFKIELCWYIWRAKTCE